MYKRIIALCLALCLLLSASPVYAGADAVPTVSAGTATVTAGSGVWINVDASSFDAVASLDLYVYYDADALTLENSYAGSMLSGAQTDVNTATAGTVKLSTISLDGLSGDDRLLRLYFRANEDCTPGTYPIRLAVGDAYGADLSPVSIDSADGVITVEATEEVEQFLIYCSLSTYQAQKGDLVQYSVTNRGYPAMPFTGAEFTVEYDPELFAFRSCTLTDALLTDNAIYTVNSDTLGKVRISYINTEPVSAYNLLTVELEVIADQDTVTTLSASAENVYREDLTAYGAGSYSRSLTLTKLPVVVDYPDACLETEKMIVGQECTSLFYVEAGACLAAADFTVTYDPAVLRCVAVTKAEASHGGLVIINDNFSEGKIRFSYVNTNTFEEELDLVQITWEPLQSPSAHYGLTLSGKGVVDVDQTAVTLEYVTDTGCIHQAVVTPPTCVADGYTTYSCNGCGDSYTLDPVPMLGHDLQTFDAKAPTCTEGGWSEGEGCARCDYRIRGEVYAALGHDLIDHEAKEPNCTEFGWYAYQTCSRCDYSSYVERPALGHRVVETQEALVDPVVIDNTGENAFVLENGTYYSNNHDDSSTSFFTVTALYDCSLMLVLSVSSESRYDKLAVLLNGSEQTNISGEVSGQELSLSLTAGDVVMIRYTKDSSVDRGSDCGWVSLQYEDVLVQTQADVSAESKEQTCLGPVVCAYCQTVVKEALEHTWSEDGTIPRVCAGCGSMECDVFGHSYQKTGTEPTCTEPGYAVYSCTVCGHSYEETLTALGHALVDRAYQAPTCTQIGWQAHQTCSRCDYSSYAELAALGHRVVEMQEVLVDPLVIDNTGENAFVLENGTYYSNNHDANSVSGFTVTALYDCTLNLILGVSSESNFDKLTVLCNGNYIAEYSGEMADQNLTRELTAGDVIAVQYAKDGSVSSGSDQGWVSLQYAYVWGEALTDVPAESREPTCSAPVTCHYCDAVVKEALAHTWEQATCTEAKFCTVCNTVEGEALGHDWIEASCTAPKTCSTCGTTEGDPLGHSWQDATCTAPKTCSTCGTTEGDPLGHSCEEFVCMICGKTDLELLTAAMDLSGDGRVTAFDAQMLAEVDAGIRLLSQEQRDRLKKLTVQDLLDFVLGAYPVLE